MNIFLIIIGSVLFLICSWFALGTHAATKNQKNWDEIYKALEEKNINVSEEEAYTLMKKMNLYFSFAALFGLLFLIFGILLTIF